MILAGTVTVIPASVKMKKARNKTRTAKFPQGKPTVEFSASWLEYKIGELERKYDDLSKKYAHCVSIGVGLNAVGILDTLRNLAFLYTDIAAHKDALRSLKTEI